MFNIPDRASIFIPDDEKAIRGCVQIIHGMAEHRGRYKELATFLKDNGFVVVTSDLRGHGDNVKEGEPLGHFSGAGVKGLVKDAKEINDIFMERWPEKKRILIGHSMGTLISVSFFKKHGDDIDMLFLSGMPGDNPAKAFAKPMLKVMSAFKGWRYKSRFVAGLVNGPLAKAFISEGDIFAWLSVDKENVRRYNADPKCGYLFTLDGYYTLMQLMSTVYGRAPFKGRRRDIPVRLVSGADDPCRVNDKTFLKSVNLFKRAGFTDVTRLLIPGQRHEIFNDTKKEQTMHDLLKFLTKK